MESGNPYRPPTIRPAAARTPNDYTVLQCAAGFAAAGITAGLVGGPVAMYANSMRWPTASVLVVPGVLFGFALWGATSRFVGGLPSSAAIGLVGGCLTGFACMGLIFDDLGGGALGPPRRPDDLLPITLAPLMGMLVIASTVRVIGGFVTSRLLLSVWLSGSILGFAGFYAVLEFSRRPSLLPWVLSASIGCFQTGVLILIGWQLAIARSRRSADPNTS